MHIDTTQAIMSIKGEPLKDGDGTLITVGSIIQTALLGQLKGDDTLEAPAKVKLFKLAQVAEKPLAEFSAPEITKIMDRVGRAFPPLIVGRAQEILDPVSGDKD